MVIKENSVLIYVKQDLEMLRGAGEFFKVVRINDNGIGAILFAKKNNGFYSLTKEQLNSRFKLCFNIDFGEKELEVLQVREWTEWKNEKMYLHNIHGVGDWYDVKVKNNGITTVVDSYIVDKYNKDKKKHFRVSAVCLLDDKFSAAKGFDICLVKLQKKYFDWTYRSYMEELHAAN